MKPLNCDYFPQLPARWHCPRCEINLSAPCIRARDNEWNPVPEHRCPICLGQLESLGIGHSIPPFWTRIPQFLAYPAKPEALMPLLVAALINALPSFTINVAALALPFFKILMAGICLPLSTAILLMYAFTCLNHSAKGHLDAPSAMLENYSAIKISLTLKQLFIYIVFIIVLRFSAVLGDFGLKLCAMLILLSIPASTMILAMTGSILSAINPAYLWEIIKTIGRYYLVFFGLFLLMLICQIFLQTQIFLHSPDFFVWSLTTLVQGYFSFALFAMMGYVMYQYHQKLGIKQVQEFTEDEKKPIPELSNDPFMNEITILLREKFHDVAIKRLKAKIYDTGQLNYCERLHQILQAPGYEENLVQNTPVYIDAIFRSKESETKQLQMAAQAYQACLRIKTDFFYPQADVVFKLAEYAHQQGRHNLTSQLLTEFHLHFPQSRLIPKAYFLLASTLVDHLGNDKKAKQLFLFLLKTYPEHKVMPQVREYLQFLNQLTG